MNILLTEAQYKRLVENNEEQNSKPSRYFDSIYGTSLSHTYDFGGKLTSDDVWSIWSKCRDNDDCDDMAQLIKNLPNSFPYYDVKKLSPRQKAEMIMGMASEYSPSDIVYFVVHKVYYENNVEQKRLEKLLPPEVEDNIRWVLSPESIEQIRNRFEIHEI